ncbi:DUF2252 domain-containing protein [Allosaccharopolyspora coralli]|uniref:DUF2252 domain-containing protein n=1 Tax=Allosaccharopolyspora coralli TaxID=2665642 RepID=A0A5Q3QC50_9PSEU|nr:DUF2252 domain-containing protein [Allosaccharopolyspora coralli]QGK68377.1 DUF2252 domain-containing protein [Allosaccharopolyspora coralli]
MNEIAPVLDVHDPDLRRGRIIDTLVEAFSDLMEAAPLAFRTKFRKMAASPWAFYRGTACLFYTDVARLPDPWADERTSRVWIQGDLHAENFGTFMDAEGVLIFDLNDFDEAYLGHFTWDLQRFAASIALLGWRKAFPDEQIDTLVRSAAHAYLDQVRRFVSREQESEFSLRLDTTDGILHHILRKARLRSRAGMLDSMTETEGYDRRFRDGVGVRRLGDDEYARVSEAFQHYLTTIPQHRKMPEVAYTVKDLVGRSGFGIGSAGLPAYSVLIEGPNEALENDIVLSMKQGNVAAPSRVVPDEHIRGYFRHHGQRTALSQRALQAHADPLLGYTELGGVGYVVDEVSPYESDLDWGELNEPEEIVPVLDRLARAVAKAHCISDADSDQDLVTISTEQAIADAVNGKDEDFVRWLSAFARDYADVVRDDHRLFVDAFRNGEIPGVTSTRVS